MVSFVLKMAVVKRNAEQIFSIVFFLSRPDNSAKRAPQQSGGGA
jgi:hypothetical protein